MAHSKPRKIDKRLQIKNPKTTGTFHFGWCPIAFSFVFSCKRKSNFPKRTIFNPNLNIQAQPIDPDLTAKLLGRGVAVSPIVTVEPRRRKFHKAITLSMPAPKAHSQGMINQYSGNAPTLRLLCSITGKKIHIFNIYSNSCYNKNNQTFRASPYTFHLFPFIFHHLIKLIE